jgi:hypothetical protein
VVSGDVLRRTVYDTICFFSVSRVVSFLALVPVFAARVVFLVALLPERSRPMTERLDPFALWRASSVMSESALDRCRCALGKTPRATRARYTHRDGR